MAHFVMECFYNNDNNYTNTDSLVSMLDGIQTRRTKV